MIKQKNRAMKKLSILISLSLLMLGGRRLRQYQPKTLPLIPMMQQLLSDMNQVNTGIFTENYEMIARGSHAIADHPAMTPSDKQLIKQTLGNDFPQFVKIDMQVHHHADSIAAAARNHDMREVLRHQNIVKRGCVSCHSEFRQRIIDAKQQP